MNNEPVATRCEYQIAIFGTTIKSQDGLFRLDEIRREGISIGNVEDNRSTEIARFMRTKVGRHLMNPKNGLIKKIDIGRMGTSWLASPTAACEFARWLDWEYGLSVSEAFMTMTNLESVQSAVAESALPDVVKAFVSEHKEREKDVRQEVHARMKRRNWG